MLKCSHVVYKVNCLEDIVKEYRERGFDVQWGSMPNKAFNAFIRFRSGPFIEFLELPRRYALLRYPLNWFYGSPAGKRMAYWATCPEGWCDVALEEKAGKSSIGTEDIISLQDLYLSLRNSGITLSRPIAGKRRRPDGQLVRYNFMLPEPGQLPFIVSPYFPSQRPTEVVHPNGALEIKQILMGCCSNDQFFFDKFLPDDHWLMTVTAEYTHVQSVILYGADCSALKGSIFSIQENIQPSIRGN